MMTQEINEKWCELTNDGRDDSRVHDACRLIDELTAKLKARYNISAEALTLLLSVKANVENTLKSDLVVQWNSRRMSAEREL